MDKELKNPEELGKYLYSILKADLTNIERIVLGHFAFETIGEGKETTKGDYNTLSYIGSKPTVLKALHSLLDKDFIGRIPNNHEVGPKKGYIYKLKDRD